MGEGGFQVGGLAPVLNFPRTLSPKLHHWQQHPMSRSCDPYSHNEVRTVFSLSFLSLKGNDVTKKLDMARTWSTIQKQAKRTPDIIVKTTYQ